MKTRMQQEENCSIAATVAPEDLRRGDFVAILSAVVELPSYYWPGTMSCERDEVVRIRYLPTDDRTPLKIKEICLPFVFVKQSNGDYKTIDIRLASLVRLERGYAKAVWKALQPPGENLET